MYIKLPSAWRRLQQPMIANYTSLAGERTTNRPIVGEYVYTAGTGNKLLVATDLSKEDYRSFVVGRITIEVPADKKDMTRMKP